MDRLKKYSLVLVDALIIVLSYWIGLHIRFSVKEFIELYQNIVFQWMALIVAIKLIVYIATGLYRIMWSFASVKEYMYLFVMSAIANFISIAILILINSRIPKGIYPVVVILDAFFLAGVRVLYRVARGPNLFKKNGTAKRLLIVGAGEAGDLVLREVRRNPHLGYNIVGFVDDDKKKIGRTIHGVRVAGGREDLARLVETYEVDEIIIALPSASDEDRKDIIERAYTTKAKVRTVPGVYQFISPDFKFTDIREVSIEDLLHRDPIELDHDKMRAFLTGKRVLVTGGGGSIGSELSRQIASFKPAELILLDIYENNVYNLQLELRKNYPDLNLVVLIDSVRNCDRMRTIFESHKPEIVFHAAAHKHVPLMEDSPQSAVLNNVFGTLNLASLSDEFNVEKFVMISTDKAVNPTNVMGTTKRLGEMIVQAYDPVSETDFVAVRFGNVLGSSGSVIPLFRKQIRDGGPVTVTHEDINRYFMTIPEASELVLAAGSLASGGEVFILDMGKPVKIIDLAKDMIRLSGLELDKDIKIEITGLRPGEKLYEELLLDKSKAKKTQYEKIWIESPPVTELPVLMERLKVLREIAMTNETDRLIQYLTEIVDTYKPNRAGYDH
ncbi:polysaccharide biosynthesis protein [Guggenheimella bovis]